VDAPGIRTTAIVGAWVGIIAIEGWTALTSPAGTGISSGAGIGVVAGERVINNGAAIGRCADIIGAKVAVITWEGIPWHAPAVLTLVAHAALILVVTVLQIRRELAAGIRVTGIVGARVAVIAGKFALTSAITQLAAIAVSAEITVVARRRV